MNENRLLSEPVPPETLFGDNEARLRAELYIKNRLKYQDGYYARRAMEYSHNADFMLRLTAAVMGISAMISALSVGTDKPIYAFLTALLPAFAGMVSAFQSLYQWQRQAKLYQETRLALRQAELVMPDSDFPRPESPAEQFTQLVQEVETVLRNEAQQWGQLLNVQTTGTSPQGGTRPPSGQGGRSRTRS